MSDLIRRSKAISILEQLEEHSLSGKMDISNAIYLLKNQPTAYDIDKVVEELEKQRDIIFQNTDSEIRTVRANAWDKIDILNKAIEIVKQVSDETEPKTIRDKAIQRAKFVVHEVAE